MKPLRRVLLSNWLLLGLIALTGCPDQRNHTRSRSVPLDFTQYASLPRVRQTHHVGLRDEVARLVDERATPELLVQTSPSTKVANKKRIEGELAALFTPLEKKTLRAKIDRIFPVEAFDFDEKQNSDLRILMRESSSALEKYRQATKQLEKRLFWPHDLGTNADGSWLEVIRLGYRLEVLAAANHLANNDLDAAMQSLDNLSRTTATLADISHVVPRLMACLMRKEMLLIVAAMVQHAHADGAMQQELFARFTTLLDEWPDDAATWIGERSDGLHTYEMIRDGHLLSVFTNQELKRLQDNGKYANVINSVQKTLDEDQFFYLTTMRRVIESCRQPFSDRLATFFEIRHELATHEVNGTYPYIAAELLLTRFEDGHYHQACDRARCEAWHLALSMAIRNDSTVEQINGLTGQPYRVLQHSDRIVVWGALKESEDRPITVPRR